jgi:hypothetical protein
MHSDEMQTWRCAVGPLPGLLAVALPHHGDVADTALWSPVTSSVRVEKQFWKHLVWPLQCPVTSCALPAGCYSFLLCGRSFG